MKKYNLAAIGTGNSTQVYRILGAECFDVVSASHAEETLIDLTKKTQEDGVTPLYAVIFVEESLHAALSDDTIDKLTRKALPSVIPLPGQSSNTQKKGYGVSRLSKLVERAVGSDIFS